MTLLDPTLGVGYAFGEKLPSTHMTTIATQQPRALDIVSGGSYTQAGQSILDGEALKGGGVDPIRYTNLLGVTVSGANAETRWTTGHPVFLDATTLDTAGAAVVNANAGSTVNLSALVLQTGQFDNVGAVINYDAATVATWTGATNLPRIGTRTYVRSISLTAGQSYSASPTARQWNYPTNESPAPLNNPYWLQNVATTGTEAVLLPVSTINRSTMTQVDVTINGGYGLGHPAGPIAGVLPTISLIKQDVSNGSLAILGTQADTSATGAAYDLAHTISLVLGVPEPVTDGFEYHIKVTGEDMQSDTTVILGASVSFECTQIAPG